MNRTIRLRAVLLCSVLVMLTFAVYWPALDAGFVGDDVMILHRLRDVQRADDALRFFRGEFFGYYRPLGFLSHAGDWLAAGPDARQFHLTNLALHGINAVLVFLVACVLARRTGAGGALTAATIAGVLFALDASNHEAVVWVSARFDLLATGLSLAALGWMLSGARGHRWGAPILFLPALLSKESAVALPVAAAAWPVFVLRASTRETIQRIIPWLVVLLVYALLREAAGGVSATGGAGRIPKLLGFGAMLAFVIGCADERWLRLRDRLLAHRRILLAALLTAAAAAALMIVKPTAGVAGIAREKLTVTGFAMFYLLLPAADVPAGGGDLRLPDEVYRIVAFAGLPPLMFLAWRARQRLLSAGSVWFLAAWLAATLLPISALTEGRRYLYLPSTAVAVAAGILVARAEGRRRRIACALVFLVVAVSTLRIAQKLDDWRWAGQMTADGARQVDSLPSPACDERHVVFLTSPVGIRGVYSHFYYETFALPRGCIPARFDVLARVLRLDTHVNAEWSAAGRIVLTIPDYRENLVLSRDLRHFDLPLRDVQARAMQTPIGELRAEREGTAVRLTFTPQADARARAAFFYYSDGSIRRLEPPAS